MDEDQLERLLVELAATRASLDAATKAIKWNKINTIIQYCLLFAVFVMGTVGVVYYFDDRRRNCEAGNETRQAINEAIDVKAAAIGFAIAVVSNAPEEALERYLEIYNEQADPAILSPREC